MNRNGMNSAVLERNEVISEFRQSLEGIQANPDSTLENLKPEGNAEKDAARMIKGFFAMIVQNQELGLNTEQIRKLITSTLAFLVQEPCLSSMKDLLRPSFVIPKNDLSRQNISGIFTRILELNRAMHREPQDLQAALGAISGLIQPEHHEDALLAIKVYLYEQMPHLREKIDEQDLTMMMRSMLRTAHPGTHPKETETRPSPSMDETIRIKVELLPPEMTPPSGIAKQSDRETADQYHQYAETEYRKGNYWRCKELIMEAIERDPNCGGHHLLLALSYAHHHSFLRDAEKSYLKAISLEPWNADFQAHLAEFYYKHGLVARAKLYCNNALKLTEKHPRAVRLLNRLKEEHK